MIADTTFLIDLARGDPGARAALAKIEADSEALRVPAPALAKFWEALERSRRPPREADALRELFLGLPAASFEPRHAMRAGRLLADAAADGTPLDVLDALVLAVALVDDETLVTRSVAAYAAIPELRLRTY